MGSSRRYSRYCTLREILSINAVCIDFVAPVAENICTN